MNKKSFSSITNEVGLKNGILYKKSKKCLVFLDLKTIVATTNFLIKEKIDNFSISAELINDQVVSKIRFSPKLKVISAQEAVQHGDKICEKIKQLQSIKLPKTIANGYPYDKFTFLVKHIKKPGLNYKLFYDGCKHWQKQLDYASFVIAHNDLHQNNILTDGKNNFFIIDGDFASGNDKHADFASLIGECKLNKIITKKIIKKYHLNEQQINNFLLYGSGYGAAGCNFSYEQEPKDVFLVIFKRAKRLIYLYQSKK